MNSTMLYTCVTMDLLPHQIYKLYIYIHIYIHTYIHTDVYNIYVYTHLYACRKYIHTHTCTGLPRHARILASHSRQTRRLGTLDHTPRYAQRHLLSDYVYACVSAYTHGVFVCLTATLVSYFLRLPFSANTLTGDAVSL